MNKTKKFVFVFLLFVLSLAAVAPNYIWAQDVISNNESFEEQNTVFISFFYGEGCPHCAKAAEFLEKISETRKNLDFKIFEIYNRPSNAELLGLVGQSLGISISGVPFILIGGEPVLGYLNDKTTGVRIEEIINRQSKEGSQDVVGNLIKGKSLYDKKTSWKGGQRTGSISLPVIGEIDLAQWSLFALTVAIAAVDGFNPCAMWVLLFLISLLLGMENKQKMWGLGLAFIISSGIVYFLFLSAWLNLFLFLGFIVAVRILIGLVAIASGIFHIKEWLTNKEGVCKVTNLEQRQKIMEKLRLVTSQKSFVLSIIGIIGLAFAVNLIEFVCSAGLPAIYTNILSMSGLSSFEYYLFLILYIVIFMADDLLVFIVAMTTLQASGISTKYSKWSNFIGGVVIFILGVLLIFKPGWIMFG